MSPKEGKQTPLNTLRSYKTLLAENNNNNNNKSKA